MTPGPRLPRPRVARLQRLAARLPLVPAAVVAVLGEIMAATGVPTLVA